MTTFPRRPPWVPVDDPDHRRLFIGELTAEVGPGHPLLGLDATLLARRDGHDDILVALADGRVAVVHLTWRGRTELDHRWPATAVFAGLDDWERDPDHGPGS